MKRWMYYIIQWTWGLPASIIGAIAFIVCSLCGCRSYWYRNALCVVIPKNFGGISLGMFFLRGEANESVSPHEYGHTIQNMQWGPLFLLVIGLPSVIRYYWRIFYRKFIYPRNRKSLPDYDAIWFEGQATDYGYRAKNNEWSWL